MTESDSVPAEVLFETRGRIGLITLNRPRAINALTHRMVTAIRNTLDEWADDDDVCAVVLTGSGDRGLCAGGDIVSLYRDAKEGDGRASAEFWRDEYALNALIARYPKPYIAIMDGLVLGGGIGLSAHGSHRVVTERSSIGMPETSIGFIPDVGGTWLLSHAPGELGTHLALTAGSAHAADAIALGLADSYILSERIPELLLALETTTPAEAINTMATATPVSALLAQRTWIDAAYAGDSVPAIVARLRDSEIADARTAADTIESKSPMALAVTLASLRSARGLSDLEAALEQEFRVSLRALKAPDFTEGVRAQVIDKDRQPRWSPATLDAVEDAQVAAYFAPLDGVGEKEE